MSSELNRASRLSAVGAIDDAITATSLKVDRLLALREYLKKNPPPEIVEELIWSLITSNRGGYYL